MKLFILSLFLLLSLTGCQDSSTKENSNSNIQYNRLSTSIPSNETITKEVEIANYSTPIYIKDSDRTKNISITCSKINNITINSNETFSFCDTVGKATPQKGYEKADIFDSEGNVVEGYGGRKLPSKLYFI